MDGVAMPDTLPGNIATHMVSEDSPGRQAHCRTEPDTLIRKYSCRLAIF